MKIFITGVSGLLGAAVARVAASSGMEVVGATGKWRDAVPGAARVVPLDLDQVAASTRLIEEMSFDVLINCAAVAEPAVCVADPVRSQQLNVELPTALASACARRKVRMLHLSSEQVFNGEEGPYAVSDEVSPINLYGRQKVTSELTVTKACPNSAVVRAPLLLGNSLGGRRSVHEKFFETWAAGKTVKLYRDEIRQVCTADNMAEALVELAGRDDLCGVFHWAGSEPMSRWELGLKTAAHFGVSADRLQAMRRSDTPEISATRPRDLSLNLEPLLSELKTRPETVDEAIAKLVRPRWCESV